MRTAISGLGLGAWVGIWVLTIAFWPAPRLHAEAPSADEALSETEASQRAAAVAEVSYQLSLKLGAKAKAFRGVSRIGFSLRQPTPQLRLDFAGGEIQALRLDGRERHDYRYDGHFLTLPPGAAGRHQLEITYTHPYNTDGNGLYRFIDPQDQRVYLYTQFEPYSANELFPGFDQPDLKARFTVDVEAPKTWVVASTSPVASTAPQPGGTKIWRFAPSPRLSTYLVSVVAGDYQVVTDQANQKAGALPLRLFVRRSLSTYLDSPSWFSLTRRSLAYYGHYFGVAYPFAKLDQVLAPDFNAVGMENAAAITYSDDLLKRGQSSSQDHEERSSLILHEIAHQWFGDLVTMRWWDDLWLNESFATYMEKGAQMAVTSLPRAWDAFILTKAQTAMQDEAATTHPVAGKVADTAGAFASFDGITYGKGAAVLGQLEFALGEPRFRAGVQTYMRRHAFANATRSDFIAALEEASGQKLAAWTRDWLETTGINQVEAQLNCQDKRISAFALAQRSQRPDEPLRSHQTLIALYYRSADGRLRRGEVLPAHYQGALTSLPELVGQPCPDLVLPNYGDHDYVKLQLDPRSLALAKTGVAVVPEAQARLLLWVALWDMVRSGSWSLADFAAVLLQQLPVEQDDKVLELLTTIAFAEERRDSVLGLLPPSEQQPGLRAAWLQSAAATCLALAQKATAGSDRQRFWYDYYVGLGGFAEAKVELEAVLTGRLRLPGLVIDQDRRWALIEQLSLSGHPQAPGYRAAEARRDHSDRGRQAAMKATAAWPDVAQKLQWYATLTSAQTIYTAADLKEVMETLTPLPQAALRDQLAPVFFQTLAALTQTHSPELSSQFAQLVPPLRCSAASAGEFRAFVREHTDIPRTVVKSLRNAAESEERCVLIRSRLASAAQR